jgi:alginate O-acetyltransferase complex protein AlgI
MLFNSHEFLFLFLPVVFAGFFILGKFTRTAGAVWLASASLFFYGWWSIKAVPILVGSILTNYWFGRQLTNSEKWSCGSRKTLLWIALTANLLLLGFFKYANFFVSNVNSALCALQLQQIELLNVVLPIGISFFTFTQIAYLVDCWQGRAKEASLAHYFLFVTYFPHLIAGPVLHHRQMMPQFAEPGTYNPNSGKIAIGITIFTVGLAKKLLVADALGEYADVFFSGVSNGMSPMFFMSWLGVLSYTFQIYFDFSGYSDMAIGLSLLFGITLPINFHSPYKATSIIDFWRRWHISLSIFLRDYLYIPLGGNRNGKLRRYVNLLVTMLIGGLWHGANWTFVLWGGLHGVFLVINQAWRSLVGEKIRYGKLGHFFCWALTFTCVCVAWVLFRAESLASAIAVYRGMFFLNGIGWPSLLARLLPDGVATAPLTTASGGPIWLIFYVFVAFLIAMFGRNCNHLLHHADGSASAESQPIVLKWWFAPLLAGLLVFCILNISKDSPFLYFQF